MSDTILYAEDDSNDAFILRMALKRSGLGLTLFVIEDGQAAIDWLSGKGIYGDRGKYPLPDILMLDLKMPRKSGFDVLQFARATESFKNLPVIILSSSGEEKDIVNARRLGATTYFVKSASCQDVVAYLKSLKPQG